MMFNQLIMSHLQMIRILLMILTMKYNQHLNMVSIIIIIMIIIIIIIIGKHKQHLNNIKINEIIIVLILSRLLLLGDIQSIKTTDSLSPEDKNPTGHG